MSAKETILDLVDAMDDACVIERTSAGPSGVMFVREIARHPEGRKRIGEWQRAREGAF